MGLIFVWMVFDCCLDQVNNKNKRPDYSAAREFITAALFCIRITLCCDLTEQLYIM